MRTCWNKGVRCGRVASHSLAHVSFRRSLEDHKKCLLLDRNWRNGTGQGLKGALRAAHLRSHVGEIRDAIRRRSGLDVDASRLHIAGTHPLLLTDLLLVELPRLFPRSTLPVAIERAAAVGAVFVDDNAVARVAQVVATSTSCVTVASFRSSPSNGIQQVRLEHLSARPITTRVDGRHDSSGQVRRGTRRFRSHPVVIYPLLLNRTIPGNRVGVGCSEGYCSLECLQ